MVDNKNVRIAVYEESSVAKNIYAQTNGAAITGALISCIIPVTSGNDYSIKTLHDFGVDGTVNGNAIHSYFMGYKVN